MKFIDSAEIKGSLSITDYLSMSIGTNDGIRLYGITPTTSSQTNGLAVFHIGDDLGAYESGGEALVFRFGSMSNSIALTSDITANGSVFKDAMSLKTTASSTITTIYNAFNLNYITANGILLSDSLGNITVNSSFFFDTTSNTLNVTNIAMPTTGIFTGGNVWTFSNLSNIYNENKKYGYVGTSSTYAGTMILTYDANTSVYTDIFGSLTNQDGDSKIKARLYGTVSNDWSVAHLYNSNNPCVVVSNGLAVGGILNLEGSALNIAKGTQLSTDGSSQYMPRIKLFNCSAVWTGVVDAATCSSSSNSNVIHYFGTNWGEQSNDTYLVSNNSLIITTNNSYTNSLNGNIYITTPIGGDTAHVVEVDSDILTLNSTNIYLGTETSNINLNGNYLPLATSSNSGALTWNGPSWYFNNTSTNALSTTLTGYVVGTNTALSATDTILTAFGKLQAEINARPGTVTSVSLTAPSLMTVTGFPITSSGTLALAWNGTSSYFALANGGTVATSTYALVSSLANYQPIENQRLSTGNSPYFTSLSIGTSNNNISQPLIMLGSSGTISIRSTSGDNFITATASGYNLNFTSSDGLAINIITGGSITANSFIGSFSGNASSATNLATARKIEATGDGTWSVSFDGSTNVTSALTLATVNNNVGSFGSATTIPTFTVNAKGLTTAASNVLISISHSQISDWSTYINQTLTTSSSPTFSYLSLSNRLQINSSTWGAGISQDGLQCDVIGYYSAWDANKLFINTYDNGVGYGAARFAGVYLHGILSTPEGISTTTLSASGLITANGGITGNLTGHASLDLPLSGGTMSGNLLGATSYNIGASTNWWGSIYATNIYEGGTALSSKYLGISASISHSQISDWTNAVSSFLTTNNALTSFTPSFTVGVTGSTTRYVKLAQLPTPTIVAASQANINMTVYAANNYGTNIPTATMLSFGTRNSISLLCRTINSTINNVTYGYVTNGNYVELWAVLNAYSGQFVVEVNSCYQGSYGVLNDTPTNPGITVVPSVSMYDDRYLTGNQSITLSGAVKGSGTTSIATTFANTYLSGIDQALTTTSSPTFSAVHSTSLFASGNGVQNLFIGDDSSLGDCNIANTLSLAGVQDTTIGYIRFGSSGPQVGWDGSTFSIPCSVKSTTLAVTGTSTFTGTITANGGLTTGTAVAKVGELDIWKQGSPNDFVRLMVTRGALYIGDNNFGSFPPGSFYSVMCGGVYTNGGAVNAGTIDASGLITANGGLRVKYQEKSDNYTVTDRDCGTIIAIMSTGLTTTFSTGSNYTAGFSCEVFCPGGGPYAASIHMTDACKVNNTSYAAGKTISLQNSVCKVWWVGGIWLLLYT